MNLWCEIPLGVRLAAIGGAGLWLGHALNLGIQLAAGRPTAFHPWSRQHLPDPGSGWADRLPVLGWWRLRRRASEFGNGFWRRPLAIELLTAGLLLAFYLWEVQAQGLVQPLVAKPLPPDGLCGLLHAQFMCHAILIGLMLWASWVDLDEWIIPDSITIPGTLLGLFLAALLPHTLLPALVTPLATGSHVDPLHLASPGPFPPTLQGWQGLAVGLACYGAWCASLLPRLWLPRRGWSKAWRLALAYIGRSPTTPHIVRLAAAGTLAIAGVWWWRADAWIGLCTSLVGLAVSAGVVWWVRIAGSWALGREAMGFGDVTLMAMLGSFLGWQAGVLIFFLAPLAASLVGVLRVLLRQGRELPFGPYLCLAALAVLTAWGEIWNWFQPLLAMPGLIPVVLVVCLGVLPLLLIGVRLVLVALGVRE